MSDFIQLRKEFLIVTARIAVLQILPLISIPVLTKTLGSQGYGFWVQFSTALALLLPIVTLNLSFALVRHLPAMRQEQEKRDGAYSVLIAVAVTTILASLLTYFNGSWIAQSFFDGQIGLVNLLCATLPVASLNLVFLDILRAERKIPLHSVLMISERTLIVLLAISFIYLKQDISIILSSWLFVELLLFGYFTFQTLRRWGIKVPTFHHLREYLDFAVPMLLAAIGVSIVNFSDRYFIAYFLDVSSVGIYNAGYVLGSSLMILVAPFTFLLPSVIAKHWDHKELDQVETIINYSFKYYVALAIPMAVGVSLISLNLLRVLSTETIAVEANQITIFSALSSIMFGIYFFFTRDLYLQKKSYPIAVQWLVAALINAVLNFILVPSVGLYGAAISTLVAFLVIAGISILSRPGQIPISVTWPFLLKCALGSAIMGLALFLLLKVSQSTLWLLFVIIMGALIYFAFALATGAISVMELRGLMKREFGEKSPGLQDINSDESEPIERFSI